MNSRRSPLWESLTPLIVDAGAPMAAYYALKGAGVGTFTALAVSGVFPAARTVWGLVRDRRLNAFAALVLAVNAVGLALSAVSGDPRLMLAKDSAVSSVIGVGILLSAACGRPLMTTVLKPWVTKNGPDRTAAWDRLMADDPRFRRYETRFSLVWGTALVTECVLRVIGAYTVPVDTMVGLGTVVLVVTLAAAAAVSGRWAVGPMEELVTRRAHRPSADQDMAAPAPGGLALATATASSGR
ncbi:VC0807 family protein [Streptomyces sp. NPDC047071]|uniref:VC0807 family protein n=1 Tax=Streptomyces sp. NPDC047071 TaxID=3154808 RepID=UPI0034563948